jgi:hypothetical protein
MAQRGVSGIDGGGAAFAVSAVWWQRPSEVGACAFAGACDADDVGDELVAWTLVERTGVER